MPVQLSSPLYIKVNGQMADDIVMGNVLQLLIDQHCQLPDMFQIRLNDPNFNYIDSGFFDLATEIEIGSFSAEEEPVPLIKGEVTALEPDFTSGTVAYLMLRGYDRSHRLYREAKSRAFVNVKDSDLAEQIANEAGLQSDITPTRLVYEHILQHNQSDLTLLQTRADRIGFVCYVAGQTLHFHPPAQGQDRPVTLTWGENNLAIRPRLKLADQVDEVIVRGWDPEKQTAVVGIATNGNLLPDIKAASARDNLNTPFGPSRAVIIDEQIHSQTEADIIATATMDARSGSFIELSGSIFRRPDVQAGCTISLEGIGERFSGRYVVTQATHTYDGASGFETDFAVRGLRRGLITENLGNEQNSRQTGVMPAIVTNNNDPLACGRVKLKYPWLTDDAESFWARVLSPGDSALTPAVGEEVLVSFEQGNLNRPVVLGKLPRLTAASSNGQSQQQGDPAATRRFTSRGGHTIELADGPNQRLTIQSNQGHQIELNDQQGTITISSKNGLSFTMNDHSRQIAISGNGAVKIAASSTLDLSAAGNVSIKAGGQLNLKGAMVNIN